ncbi:NADP-dependent oxidoreductase domain-containing protein [Armillaria nabsnona]|nr:NADP-dependent oxidoreductase domain-containing protein [Armillaria nabsnona]
MSVGDKWEAHGMGSMNKESSFKLLDAYFDMGGNFIDTANGYQDETSEEFIGEWAEKRGIRDQLVIATKYTTNFINVSYRSVNARNYPMMRLDYGVLRRQASTVHPDSGSNPDYVTDPPSTTSYTPVICQCRLTGFSP